MSKITISADLLVEAALGGRDRKSEMAERILARADLIAIPLATICSFVSELSDKRGVGAELVSDVVRSLLNAKTVAADRAAIAAGLAVFESGGRFSDGVAALEGRRLGAGRYVSLEPEVSAHVEAVLRHKY